MSRHKGFQRNRAPAPHSLAALLRRSFRRTNGVSFPRRVTQRPKREREGRSTAGRQQPYKQSSGASQCPPSRDMAKDSRRRGALEREWYPFGNLFFCNGRADARRSWRHRAFNRPSRKVEGSTWNPAAISAISGSPGEWRVRMKFQFKNAGSLLAGAALLVAAASPAMAEVRQHESKQPLSPNISTGACLLTGMKYSVSTDLQKTASRAYRDVTGTSVSFTQSQAGCVEVDFSAEAAATPNELLVSQVVLDGSTTCLPADNILASDSPSSDLAAHAMNY